MFYLPEGAKLYFSSTFAAALTVSAATNANPSVMTSTTHGLTDGDELLYVGGWTEETDSVFVADSLTADTFSLLDLDSSNTTLYQAGGGVGTVQVVSNWLEMPQPISIDFAGGDLKETPVELLNRTSDLSLPNGFTATKISTSLAHDPDQANWKTMRSLSKARSKVAFKLLMPDGAACYAYGHISVNNNPRIVKGQVNQVMAYLGVMGRVVSYGAA